MQNIKADKDQIAEATEAVMGRLCALLRSVPSADSHAVGTWTIRDVAAHLASGVPLYVGIVRGEGSTYTDLARVADFNAAGVASIREQDCDALADQVESAVADFVTAVRTTPGDPDVAWHAGLMLPVSTVAATLLGEALIHGYDLARASGRPWLITPAQARLVFTGLLPLLPYFVNREAATGVHASFDIRLRGKDSAHVQFVFADGALHISTTPGGPVDCHVSANPTAFLLVMYGRQGTLRPAITGKVIAWGRKPWLAFRMPSLLHQP
ncbi:MAG: maleylpyruvate isomerase family mycothiol-dependent enzyme [Pseudonocardiaceae bacterium]